MSKNFSFVVVIVFVTLDFFCPLGLQSLCIGAFSVLTSLHMQLFVGLQLVFRAYCIDRFDIGDSRIIHLINILAPAFFGILDRVTYWSGTW